MGLENIILVPMSMASKGNDIWYYTFHHMTARDYDDPLSRKIESWNDNPPKIVPVGHPVIIYEPEFSASGIPMEEDLQKHMVKYLGQAFAGEVIEKAKSSRVFLGYLTGCTAKIKSGISVLKENLESRESRLYPCQFFELEEK